MRCADQRAASDSRMTADVGLVHLVFAPLGVAPFERFMASYREHESGIDHELVVIYNGFPDEVAPDEFTRVLGTAPHHSLFIHPPVVDWAAYLDAARSVQHSVLCFVNSYSAVLADDWLACMDRHLREPGVGLVGATGSWESHLTAFDEQPLPHHSGPLAGLRRAVDRYRRRRERRRYASLFAAFPNEHLRTNAFMMRRELLLDLEAESADDKLAAHALESGRHSITAQIAARGLRVLVVGRDGEAYEPASWRESATFRAGDQRNLLGADNRTRQYADADAQEKASLERAAWGAVE
jgi:hypothetical protein